jgi:streptomycin 6-kinase
VIASSDVVSAPWLSRTLERPIASAVASRIGTVNGFAGVVLRLELFGSDGTTFSVIAKVGPDPSLDAEIRFYGRLAAALDAPAPDCLYAGAGPTGAPMLLLEDLSAARHGDALAGAPVADVAAVVESMVAFWRHRVDDPSLADLPQWGGEPVARQRRYAENWVAQRDALVDELPPDIWQTADRLVASLAQVAADLRRAPGRAVHADLHLDNILFTDRGPVVLDWGSICVASPVVDVFSFVGTSLSPADQTRHFADLADLAGLDATATDDGRRRLLCALAGVIGWRNRAPSGNPREHALRVAALGDGRLINALRLWDAAVVLP